MHHSLPREFSLNNWAENDSNKPRNKEEIIRAVGTNFEPMEFHTIETPGNEITGIDSAYKPEKIEHSNPAKHPWRETFAHMKEIGKNKRMTLRDYYGGYYVESYPEIFLAQAEYMKDFTDSYTGKKFYKDSPTYNGMGNLHLRTYFTWRTKVREGNVEDTSLSCVFRYINEIINNVGVRDDSDVIDELISFWDKFRACNNKIDRYLAKLIKDYYIINHSSLVGNSFEDIALRYPISYVTPGAEDIYFNDMKRGIWAIEFIELYSNYKITDRAFYKAGNTKIIKECLSFVVGSIDKLFKENALKFEDLFTPESHSYRYWPLSDAIYAPRMPIGRKTVKLSENEIYEYKDRQWYVNKRVFNTFPQTKGYILKAIEIQMRKALGGRQNLTPQSLDDFRYELEIGHPLENKTKWKKQVLELIKSAKFEHTIVTAIQDYIKSANITVKDGNIIEHKPIEIDMSQLERIRDEHIQTATKLNVEDEAYEPPKNIATESPIVATPLNGFPSLIEALSNDEKILLTSLLSSKAVTSIQALELVVEQINEKALEAITDNLIEELDGKYSVYAEYQDELLSALGDVHE